MKLGNLMKQAQQMQEGLAKAQEAVKAIEVTGESGAGLVKVAMTGSMEVSSVCVDPQVLEEPIEMLEDLLAADAWCYDMMYGSEQTAFCSWALQHGAVQAIDGLGMLVEQAAESFSIWRGVRPDTAPVIARMRAALAG